LQRSLALAGGNTGVFDAWPRADEILRMFVFPYSNGITEGFHRKMKLIQRRAYGFRNFQNYRLRVIVLCGHLPQAGL
jgi:hypothetical protein